MASTTTPTITNAPTPPRREAPRWRPTTAPTAAPPCRCTCLDIGGDCTPLYCIVCLERGIADDGHRAELVWLKAFIDGLDALLARG